MSLGKLVNMLFIVVFMFLLNFMIFVKLCFVKFYDFLCFYIVKLFLFLCIVVRLREVNWNFLIKIKWLWIVLDFFVVDIEMWRILLFLFLWELKENEKFCCGDLVYLVNWDLGWIWESCLYELLGSCCWLLLFIDLWIYWCGMRWIF